MRCPQAAGARQLDSASRARTTPATYRLPAATRLLVIASILLSCTFLDASEQVDSRWPFSTQAPIHEPSARPVWRAAAAGHRYTAHGAQQQQHWRHRLQRPQVAVQANSKTIRGRPPADEHSSISVSQQVPEQTAVVVSSSDNSYVSASPIVVEQLQPTGSATTTTNSPTTRAPQQPLVVLLDSSQSRVPNVSAQFQWRPATIIKTRESLAAGATFINYTLVTSLNACLVECWITDSCDTAIYQESPVEFSNSLPVEPEPELKQSQHGAPSTPTSGQSQAQSDGATGNRQQLLPSLTSLPDEADDENHDDQLDGFYVCYLFQCANSQGFKCQFSAHNYYVSATTYHQAPLFGTTNSTTAAEKTQPPEASYSKLISSRHWLPVRTPLHDTHLASIHIGREQVDERQAGLNSALIALLVGVGATSVLLMIVGRKMDSIRRRAVRQHPNHRSTSPQRAAEAVANALIANHLHNQQLPVPSHCQPLQVGGQSEIIKKATSSVFIERPRRSLLSRATLRLSNLLLATNSVVRLPAI